MKTKSFDNMALYFKCRIHKKRTPSDCFLAIIPTWVEEPEIIIISVSTRHCHNW